MALEPSTVVSSNYGFIDNNRKVSTTGLFLPNGLTLAQYDAYVLALGQAMGALSNAGLQVATYNRSYFDAVIDPTALPNESEVERKLVLIFGTDNRYVEVTMEIPSPVFTIEADNTDEVSIADPLVAALADLVINGPVGIENGVVAAAGLQVTFLKRAYIRHRSRRATR